MSPGGNVTTIILFGSVHLDPSQYAAFAARYRTIIEEVRPDVICAELSPEQVSGVAACDSKPDLRDIVIPFARTRTIPLIPIQPAWTTEWEDRFAAVGAAAGGNAAVRLWDRFSTRLAEEEARLLMDYLREAKSIEELQSNSHHAFFQARDAAECECFPLRAALWNDWNTCFLEAIIEAVRRYPCSRLLVIVGLRHKYWLWNALSDREGIILHNLATLRRPTPGPNRPCE